MRSTDRRGFTLVEALVALAVAVVVATMLHGLLSAGARTFRQVDGKTAGLESSALAYELVAQEVRQLTAGSTADSLDGVLVVENPDADGWGDGLSLPARGATFRIDGGCLAVTGRRHRTVRLTEFACRVLTVDDERGHPRWYLALRLVGDGSRSRDDNLLVALLALEAPSLRAANPYWVD